MVACIWATLGLSSCCNLDRNDTSKRWCVFCCKIQSVEPPVETTRLPLCPRLAERSYTSRDEGRGKLISAQLSAAMKERGIKFTPLSHFVGEFSGAPGDIKWLRESYPNFLCSFSPEHIIHDERTHSACIRNAQKWIALVDAGKIGELMDIENFYCASCCQSPDYYFDFPYPDVAPIDSESDVAAPTFDELRWDSESRILSGRTDVTANLPLALRIAVPSGYKLKEARVNGIKIDSIEVLDGVAVLTIAMDDTATVSWEIDFGS